MEVILRASLGHLELRRMRLDRARDELSAALENGTVGPVWIEMMRKCPEEPSLSSVREPEHLAALPPGERELWMALWADVKAFNENHRD